MASESLSPNSKDFSAALDGQPPPFKRAKLEENFRPHSNQPARTTSDGYITPGNTSEATGSISSGTNSISSGSSGVSGDRKESNSEESEEVPSQEPVVDRPNREFLRQDPPRVNRPHTHTHPHTHAHPQYPVTAIPFPVAQPITPSEGQQPMAAGAMPARFMSIEPTQLPIATVAVPIPAANMPVMPPLHPMVYPPLPGPQLPAIENGTSSATSGASGAPMSPAITQTQLPSPQQIMTGFDPSYTLAFHYHFYPPGVSFYPVGIPTGVPGIVFPGTLNHGLYQTPNTASSSSSNQSPRALRSSADARSSSDSKLASSASSTSSGSSIGSMSAMTNSIPTMVPYGMYPLYDSNKSKVPVVGSSKRQYRCPYDGCEWSFTRASDQRRHIKSHEKPKLQCPFWTPRKSCHRNSGAFNRLDVLKRHLRLVHFEPLKDGLHSGTTSGRCRHCRVDFATIKDFVNHCNACAAHLYSSSSGSSGSSSGSGADSSSSDGASFND